MSDSNHAPPASWLKGFWSLMITQSQNAFSDNALKFLVIGYALTRATSESERSTVVSTASALYAVPFIFLSMFGGWLADRFSKAAVMRRVKLAEIGIMLLAALGLGLRNIPLEYAAVFCMGCHSAIFGPSKYGILPEILPLERLSWGNGLLELLTFVGIILGMMGGGYLADNMQEGSALPGLILMALAFVGWFISLHITKVPAADPTAAPRLNPLSDWIKQMRILSKDRALWRANWGNAGFWFVAALVQQNLVIYSDSVLHLDKFQNTMLIAALLIGIGVGSAAAGFLSRGKIQYGFVAIGAIGLALSTVPMGIAGLGVHIFIACLISLGFFAGLFIVPIAAVLQHRPPPEAKGAVQGAANLLSWIGIFAASGVQFLLSALHVPPGRVFWFCGVTAILAGVYTAASRPGSIRNLLQSLFKGAS